LKIITLKLAGESTGGAEKYLIKVAGESTGYFENYNIKVSRGKYRRC